MPDPVVCIVDDDPGVVRSLEMFFEAHGLSTQSYASAEAFLEGPGCGSVSCLLLDMRLPGQDGLSLIESLAGQNRLPPTIVLTAHGDVQAAVRAMRLGALDFMTKPYDTDQLLTRVRRVLDGSVLHQTLQKWRSEIDEGIARLSPREKDILHGMARGQTSKEIASELGLKSKSVEIYRSQVLAKLGADSSIELIRRVASVRPELTIRDD